jgi:ubiquinone/menaquinone biosynthesis C-methylase UbiE
MARKPWGRQARTIYGAPTAHDFLWPGVLEALELTAEDRLLDVGCGGGAFLRHVRETVGCEVAGVDHSRAMVRLAAPYAALGDAQALPFADGEFERVVTSHFYGHLDAAQRSEFLAQARRLAGELVVVDSARRDRDEEWQERVLNDGSRWNVFKRYFTGERLAAELGGGETLHEGEWFVVVRSEAR